MKCDKCGKEINEQAKFCKYCGNSVEYHERTITEKQKDKNGNESNRLALKGGNKKKVGNDNM